MRSISAISFLLTGLLGVFFRILSLIIHHPGSNHASESHATPTRPTRPHPPPCFRRGVHRRSPRRRRLAKAPPNRVRSDAAVSLPKTLEEGAQRTRRRPTRRAVVVVVVAAVAVGGRTTMRPPPTRCRRGAAAPPPPRDAPTRTPRSPPTPPTPRAGATDPSPRSQTAASNENETPRSPPWWSCPTPLQSLGDYTMAHDWREGRARRSSRFLPAFSSSVYVCVADDNFYQHFRFQSTFPIATLWTKGFARTRNPLRIRYPERGFRAG